jgi:hypothetical protein
VDSDLRTDVEVASHRADPAAARATLLGLATSATIPRMSGMLSARATGTAKTGATPCAG